MSFVHLFIIGRNPDDRVALKLPERMTPKQWDLLVANLELIRQAIVENDQEAAAEE